jgi:hypothetical protein
MGSVSSDVPVPEPFKAYEVKYEDEMEELLTTGYLKFGIWCFDALRA